MGDQGKWATGMMKKLLLLSAIPARALYQAAKADRRPKRPPAFWSLRLGKPPEGSKKASPRSRKVMSRKKKSRKNATVDLRVHRTRMKVKINQPCDCQLAPCKTEVVRVNGSGLLTNRNRPSEARNSSFRVASMWNPPGVRTIAKATQKPPYEDRAVAPKVFPTAISLRSKISKFKILPLPRI